MTQLKNTDLLLPAQRSTANANNISAKGKSLPAISTTELIPASEMDQPALSVSSGQATQFFAGASIPQPTNLHDNNNTIQLKSFSRPQDSAPLQKKCGCASCCGSSVDTDETIQRYEDMEDEDYNPEDEGEQSECEDTDYHDEDCYLKVPYRGNVRSSFYPNNYVQNTLNWKADRMDQLEDPNNAANFLCPRGRRCLSGGSIPKANGTIEHIESVVHHWNDRGHNQLREQRKNWYNDTNNHEVMCRRCNSSLGGGDVYQNEVGPGFDH